MKKTIACIFIALAAVCSAYAELVNINAAIRADSANFEIKNEGGKRLSAELEFDLRPLGGKADAANLQISGEVSGKQPMNPSLTVSADGEEIAAVTQPLSGRFETMLSVAQYIKKAAARGKDKAAFKIYQKGGDGAQRAITLKSAKLICAKDAPVFNLERAMSPIFSGGVMYDESVFPIRPQTEGPARRQLFFKPAEILEVCAYDGVGKKILKDGEDYKISGDKIELIDGAGIKVFKYSNFYSPSKDEAKKLKLEMYFETIKCYGFFKEMQWFHTHAAYVTYRHLDKSDLDIEKFDASILPRTVGKLRKGEPVTISIFGDSISFGANASARYNTAPFQPTWGDLVAQSLGKTYKSKITLMNRAFGGTNSAWGAKNIGELVNPDKPDLVILGFGMNDRCPAAERKAYLEKMISSVLAANPKAEFILVASMCANPLWRDIPVQDEYLQSDLAMQTPSITVANVRAAHRKLLEKKSFIDMTGNNVNHPNDFLIRVYAQTIAKKLTAAKK